MAFISNRITSTEFVGPLTGTSTTASIAISSSTAVSSSYAFNATSASFASTASYVLSSSYAVSSSLATSSSFATSASYTLSASMATSASFATSASYAFSSSVAVSSSYALTSSYAVSASYALSSSFAGTASFVETSYSASISKTASYIETLEQDVYMTGSWEMLGNLTVRGTASFQYTTASQTLVNQNTITVFGSGSVLPTAGYIAADTASVYTSGSWLWNFPNQYWYTTASISASKFHGTASFAATYPTREFTFAPATASWICQHNLGTKWVQVTCWDSTTNLVILPNEIEAVSTASVKIIFTEPVEGVARIS